MASIVKRGKTYSVVYYEGEGSNRHQVWESGLSYSAVKSRKATIEYEKEQNTHVDHNDITVSEFLYEFIEKYGEKKWVAWTIHDIHKVLRCAFNQAKRWEYIARNSFLDATLPEHNGNALAGAIRCCTLTV